MHWGALGMRDALGALGMHALMHFIEEMCTDVQPAAGAMTY